MPRRRERFKNEVFADVGRGHGKLNAHEIAKLCGKEQPNEQSFRPNDSDEPWNEADGGLHQSEGEGTVEQAVTRLLGEQLQLLWISEDAREAHHAYPLYDFQTGELIDSQYAFVAIRFINYSDGQQLVSWCSNKQCPDYDSRATVSDVFQGNDFSGLCKDDHWHDFPESCTCSRHAIQAEIQHRGNDQAWLLQYYKDHEDLHVGHLPDFMHCS